MDSDKFTDHVIAKAKKLGWTHVSTSDPVDVDAVVVRFALDDGRVASVTASGREIRMNSGGGRLKYLAAARVENEARRLNG